MSNISDLQKRLKGLDMTSVFAACCGEFRDGCDQKCLAADLWTEFDAAQIADKLEESASAANLSTDDKRLLFSKYGLLSYFKEPEQGFEPEM